MRLKINPELKCIIILAIMSFSIYGHPALAQGTNYDFDKIKLGDVQDATNSLAFSSDGKLIAFGNRLIKWNMEL
jgi:hypothetical protein